MVGACDQGLIWSLSDKQNGPFGVGSLGMTVWVDLIVTMFGYKVGLDLYKNNRRIYIDSQFGKIDRMQLL